MRAGEAGGDNFLSLFSLGAHPGHSGKGVATSRPPNLRLRERPSVYLDVDHGSDILLVVQSSNQNL
jgi:hypothetical protein